ncbi:MAG: hypothetical protein K2Q22_13415, partial [Cytophagales bacterium]|nr:hypothetical protein [Cytophagales bacterium]
MELGLSRIKIGGWVSWILLIALFGILPFISSVQTVEHELAIRFLGLSLVLTGVSFYILLHDKGGSEKEVYFFSPSGKFWVAFFLIGT